ncbi:MAG TPA: hypothetical protein VGL77_05275 [Armatimonadota bacterium]|jgi:hypothetical protein
MGKSKKPTVQQCACHELGDMAVLDIGDESQEVFHHLNQMRQRGIPQWWLSAYRCCVCRQWWLVAQEERQNDIFCLRRLTRKEIDRLLDYNDWPSDYDTYEELLRIGTEAGKSVQFIDPLHSSLVRTLADIAREHPMITIPEIAYLLHIDSTLATQIARFAVEVDGVVIDFKY